MIKVKIDLGGIWSRNEKTDEIPLSIIPGGLVIPQPLPLKDKGSSWIA